MIPYRTIVNFKKIGILEALTYRAFCKDHDDSIFTNIEKAELDVDSYEAQLLLSYRTTAIERRKKEVKKAHRKYFIKYLAKKRGLPEGIANHEDPDDEIARKSIEDCKLRECEFNKEINSSDNRFEFFVFSLPFYEICAVSNFSFSESNFDYRNEILFHLIPEEGELKCIIGHHSECHESHKKYVQLFCEGNESFKFEMISDILLTKIENWVVSPHFYSEYIEPNLDHYSKLINAQFHVNNLRSINKRLIINIFSKSKG